jgi:hypothetical protein
MSEPHQYELVSIPNEYDEFDRETIGIEIVELIRQRTSDNTSLYGRPFPKYTKGYSKTIEFKVAGKDETDPNLDLTGDMLRDLQVLSHGRGYIKIGFTPGSFENDKAAYVAKKRQFLGVSRAELNSILSRHTIDQDIREEMGPSFFDSIAAGIMKGLFSEPKR